MKTESPLPHFLSVKQVKDQFGVSAKTVRRWIERGELHVHRLGRQLRVSEDDINAFIAQHLR